MGIRSTKGGVDEAYSQPLRSSHNDLDGASGVSVVVPSLHPGKLYQEDGSVPYCMEATTPSRRPTRLLQALLRHLVSFLRPRDTMVPR